MSVPLTSLSDIPLSVGYSLIRFSDVSTSWNFHRIPIILHQEFMLPALSPPLWISVFWEMRNGDRPLPPGPGKLSAINCATDRQEHMCAAATKCSQDRPCMQPPSSNSTWHRSTVAVTTFFTRCWQKFYCSSHTKSFNFIVYIDSIEHRFIYILVLCEAGICHWPFCFIYINSIDTERLALKKS